jgi:hypothetical protein
MPLPPHRHKSRRVNCKHEPSVALRETTALCCEKVTNRSTNIYGRAYSCVRFCLNFVSVCTTAWWWSKKGLKHVAKPQKDTVVLDWKLDWLLVGIESTTGWQSCSSGTCNAYTQLAGALKDEQTGRWLQQPSALLEITFLLLYLKHVEPSGYCTYCQV